MKTKMQMRLMIEKSFYDKGMVTAMEGAKTFLNLSFSMKKEIIGKIANMHMATRKLMGINSVGVDPN